MPTQKTAGKKDVLNRFHIEKILSRLHLLTAVCWRRTLTDGPPASPDCGTTGSKEF